MVKVRLSLSKTRLFVLAFLLAFLSSSAPILAVQKSAFMRVYDLKAGHSKRVLANNNPVNFVDPEGLNPGAVLLRAGARVLLGGLAGAGARGAAVDALSAGGAVGLAGLAGKYIGETIGKNLAVGAGAGTGTMCPPGFRGGAMGDLKDGSMRNVFSKDRRKEKTEPAEMPMEKPGSKSKAGKRKQSRPKRSEIDPTDSDAVAGDQANMDAFEKSLKGNVPDMNAWLKGRGRNNTNAGASISQQIRDHNNQ